MAEQLTFDLPSEPALGRGDFFVSPSNAAAVEAIQSWHDWPQGKLVLIGPQGSGKTHLAHVWATIAEATIIRAADLREADVPDLARRAVAIEDASDIAGDGVAEAALFHLHNLAQEHGSAVMLTGRQPPLRWGLTLPDLQSRLQGSAIVTLSAPDDMLLAAVLVKLFADRQLHVEPRVVDWLTRNIERSFAAAIDIVDALDRTALRQSRAITQPLAARVLDKLSDGAR